MNVALPVTRVILLVLLVALYTLVPVHGLFAQALTSGDPFLAAANKLNSAKTNITLVISLIGFLGLCGLAVLAYFNRFQWKWAFSLVGGFFILAVASIAINYLTAAPNTSPLSLIGQ